ncbi:MAG: response regulator [Verrucomicrobiota bacterium]
MKILAIDDHRDNLTALQAVVSDRLPGIKVLTALNGLRGLELARAEDPDVILLDIVMPNMDGFEVCRRLKAEVRLQAIPVLFLTALRSDQESRVKALEVGAEGFLTKPFDETELIAQIRAMTKIKAASQLQRMEKEQLAALVAARTKELQQELAERKQVEKALRGSEARLRDIMFSMGDWVWETNSDLVYTYTSQKGLDFFGPVVEDIIGKTPFDFMPPDEVRRVRAIFAEIAANKAPIKDLENWNIRQNGEPICLLTNGVPILDEAGNLKGYRGVDKDITDRKRMEQERAAMEAHLRQQQKLESLGTLAAGVAHEINNPINGVMNYAQLILDRTEPNCQAQEYAREIIHETERVTTIVRNLLQFARQEKQSHSPARIQDVVEQTLSLIRTVIRRDQITLQVELPPDLPNINCRSQQIQQVLMNLLTNARDTLNAKYPGHDDNKTITLTAQLIAECGLRNAELANSEIRNQKSEIGCAAIRITVADHGTGIPADVQGRVFDPFFTTKSRHEGTGLGLAISHGIVKDHQGKLWFETEPGQGTKFHLDLPIS